jgi:hypothetical protein
MKKVFISLLSIFIFLGMVGMASAFSELFPAGTWTEMYSGGNPGSPGNTLSAISIAGNPYGTWSLEGMTLNAIMDHTDNFINGEYDSTTYITSYTGGTLNWAGFLPITSLDATVTAIIRDGQYGGTGDITLYGSGGFSMIGILSELDRWDLGHSGDIYIYEINGGIPVPEPATMLLLGLGLMGIAGIRSKYKG